MVKNDTVLQSRNVANWNITRILMCIMLLFCVIVDV